MHTLVTRILGSVHSSADNVDILILASLCTLIQRSITSQLQCVVLHKHTSTQAQLYHMTDE